MENGKNSALDDYVYCLNSLWQSKMCGSHLSLLIVLCYLQPFTIKHGEKYRQNILKSNLDGRVNENERASSLDMYQTIYSLDIRHVGFLPDKSLPKKIKFLLYFSGNLLSQTLEKCCPSANKVYLHPQIITVYACWVYGHTPHNDQHLLFY